MCTCLFVCACACLHSVPSFGARKTHVVIPLSKGIHFLREEMRAQKSKDDAVKSESPVSWSGLILCYTRPVLTPPTAWSLFRTAVRQCETCGWYLSTSMCVIPAVTHPPPMWYELGAQPLSHCVGHPQKGRHFHSSRIVDKW